MREKMRNSKYKTRGPNLNKEEKSKLAVRYILSHTKEKGYPPTMRQIASAIGVSSSSSVWKLLHHCRDEGFVDFEDRIFRSIRVLPEGKKIAK